MLWPSYLIIMGIRDVGQDNALLVMTHARIIMLLCTIHVTKRLLYTNTIISQDVFLLWILLMDCPKHGDCVMTKISHHNGCWDNCLFIRWWHTHVSLYYYIHVTKRSSHKQPQTWLPMRPKSSLFMSAHVDRWHDSLLVSRCHLGRIQHFNKKET